MAVTTFLPLRMAASTKSNAAPVPPINSTTMSISGSSTISAKSEVKRPGGSIGRGLVVVDLEDLHDAEVDPGALEDLIMLFLDEAIDARPYGAEAQEPHAHDPIPAHAIPLVSD